MEWLQEYAQAISAVMSFCTLIFWIFYAQLLYDGYARQRRPRIIINRGRGIGVDALCLISNMSTESIYVQHIIAVLHTHERTYELDVAECQQRSLDTHEESAGTHQGPLASGDYIHLHSFANIVEQLTHYWNIESTSFDNDNIRLEIRVVAIYGPEDMPVGASRHFKLDFDAPKERQLTPTSIDTQRMNKRRERKQVLQWAKQIEAYKAK